MVAPRPSTSLIPTRRPPSLSQFMQGTGLQELGMDGGMPIRMGGPGRSPSGPGKKRNSLASILGSPMGGAVMSSLGDAMMAYALMAAGGDPAEAMSGVMARRDQLNAGAAEQERYEGERKFEEERAQKEDYFNEQKLQSDRDKLLFTQQSEEADRKTEAERNKAEDEQFWAQFDQGRTESDRDYAVRLNQIAIARGQLDAELARDQEDRANRQALTNVANSLLTQSGLPPVAPMQMQPRPASASAAEAPPMAGLGAPQPQQQSGRAMPPEMVNTLRAMAAEDPQGAMQAILKWQGEANKPGDPNTLRDDYTALTKDYATVRDAYARLKEVAKDPTPAGDLALLYNYVRLLDPGSVVRESEFAIAASAGSWGTRVQGAVQKALSGERLTPDQRADFVGQADALYRGQQSSYERTTKQFEEMARRSGVNPSDVLVTVPYQDGGSVQQQPQQPGTANATPVQREVLDGREVDVLSVEPDGSKIVRDPKTGRRGRWTP